METNPLVQALKTPIKATGCPSEGYVHSWIVFALKHPPTHPHSSHPNPKFCKSPPPHTSQSATLVASRPPHHLVSLPRHDSPPPRDAGVHSSGWRSDETSSQSRPDPVSSGLPRCDSQHNDSRRGCSPPASIPAQAASRRAVGLRRRQGTLNGRLRGVLEGGGTMQN